VTTLATLRVVAAHGLDGPGRPPIDLRSDDVPPLLVEATAHKLVGLVDQALADGALRCDDASAERIGERAVEVAAASVRLERHLLGVHDLLERAAILHRFVKGATVAHRFYRHPGLRMSVDVDVLVPSSSLEAVVERLAAAGHEREQRDPYPGFSRRYAKSVAMRARGSGIEVDVHRVIADGPFGLRAAPDVLWDRPAAEVQIGGRGVPALDAAGAFVQACVNAVASYDMVSLASLRDVAQIAPAVAGDLDGVRALSDALAVTACVADAVARTIDELGWRPEPEVAAMASWPVTPREREWLESYRVRPSDARRALLGMHAVPSLSGKVAYLANVAALSTGRPGRRRARAGRPVRWPRRRSP
jgi:hypothetical protein